MHRILTRTTLITAAILSVGTATATPVVVAEGFEGSAFPPSGWRLEYNIYMATAVWNRGESAGNHYAYGYGSAGGANAHAEGYLITGPRTLNAGDTLRVTFRYTGTQSGTLASWYREVALRKNGVRVWYARLGETNWTSYEYTLAPLAQSGADYDFWWAFGCVSSYSASGSLTFGVDDILITKYSTAVAPASLGRVKAPFR
jgi:hypothetical protein